ncbi:uncharacterized protein LOC109802425 [Cajanus cajan]|uniref:TPX2 C-terminal domain-containing protein n=1 Tax=Cajanus cajan TaxID=3821 RepID=A0A151TCF5_CAJCA|nr:uncharacterized protein LOC109802425 [Cajanus cajan]KYP64729.1 hypothetical protein KK1_019334 [Cajanus cajan]
MAAVASPTPRGSRSKSQEPSKNLENFDPNKQSPVPKPSCYFSSSSSPLARSNSKKPNAVVSCYYSPQNKIRQRKFVVAKKKKEKEGAGSCKCKGRDGANKNNDKCVCVAYNNLRKSQEEFFKNEDDGGDDDDDDDEGVSETEEEEKEGGLGKGDVVVKRRRERVMEAARKSVPQSGSGKVMHLVKAFEKLLTIPAEKEDEESQEKDNNKVGKWALPGLQTTPSEASFCPPNSNCVLTSQNLGLDPGASVSSSWDSSRASVYSRTSTGGRRSRRNSLESSSTLRRRRWKKQQQQKVTSQKPFKLRTEQRGKLKDEEFVKKIQEMSAEEEKQRIPVAQGLPWTTDEPECLVKPPVKEITRPIDLKLHSDVRAQDRAEFDHQVAEKLNLIEQYKLEKERQQKLAEEEEVRRLRKELIPKAQPMPYFDRPFMPRRSMKSPTIPREPKFHNHKKIKCSLSSWSDMSSTYSSSCLN